MYPPPDLIIADIPTSNVAGLDVAHALNKARPTPVVLLSTGDQPALLERAVREGVTALLVKPVKPADLYAAVTLAVHRFRELHQARQEAAELRQALEERKVIERAKGIVMRRLHIDESEAFRRLRRQASDHNQKLVEVALQLLEADEVFRAME